MTTDQLTPEQKALSGFVPGFWDSRGWGFGLSVITRRDGVAAVPGRFERIDVGQPFLAAAALSGGFRELRPSQEPP